jgi:hypothetical protein
MPGWGDPIMMKRYACAALLTLGLVGAVPGARAAEPSVLRVIVVETADVKAYRRELEVLLRLERTVVPEVTLHVWRARFAGGEAGTLVVTAELPNLAALAKIDEFGRSSAEFMATTKRIEALRHIVSDSLYEEIGP